MQARNNNESRTLAVVIDELKSNDPTFDHLIFNSILINPVQIDDVIGTYVKSHITDSDLIQLAEAIKTNTTLSKQYIKECLYPRAY